VHSSGRIQVRQNRKGTVLVPDPLLLLFYPSEQVLWKKCANLYQGKLPVWLGLDGLGVFQQIEGKE
jgi:hypothetical protein